MIFFSFWFLIATDNSCYKGSTGNAFRYHKALKDGKSRPIGDSGNGYLLGCYKVPDTGLCTVKIFFFKTQEIREVS